ncbi:MAG: HU family DNA-binding protein, partial [Actinomycetota bacterium]|nr:HU family DNA-binding protein [Actinomycetota bacterium]
TGRNPRTGDPVPIAASRALKFSASTALKAALNPAPAKGAKKGSKSAAAKKSAPAAKKSAPVATKSAAAKAPAKKATKKSAR